MKTIIEFSDKEQKRFFQLLERAAELIDWTAIQRAVNIFNDEGPSDNFWDVYCDAVEPIVDPHTALSKAGIPLNEVDSAMFAAMNEDTEQNPDNEIKYWRASCQDYDWDLFLKILDILKEVGY